MASAFGAIATLGVGMSAPRFTNWTPAATSMLSVHLLMELFAIIIAMLVVVSSWHTFGENEADSSKILICGFLVVASCDTMHALTYAGMPNFLGPPGTPRAIFFWLMGRSFEVTTLALIVIGSSSLPWSRGVWLGLGVFTSALLAWIGSCHLDAIPETFINGQGVTPFKAGYEYVLCASNILVAALFWRRTKTKPEPQNYLLALSSFVTGTGEIMFTAYVAPSDFQNIFGHFFKLVAYAILYRATFVISIKAPYLLALETASRLQESEVRFSKAFHANPIGMLIADLPDRRMIGRQTRELGLWADPADQAKFLRLLERDGRVVAYDAKAYRKDGEVIDLCCYAEQIDVNGEHCILMVTVDVTKERTHEASIRVLNASLEQRVRDRTTELADTIRDLEGMSATISHDLRAPLRHISGFSTQLSLEDGIRSNARAVDFTLRISNAAKQMGELIDRLLENARLGRVAIACTDVSLNDMIAGYVHDLGASSGGQRIEWSIAPLPNIRADAVMARQVVQNLLENAVRYSSKRDISRIEIGPVDTAGECGFFVKDNGVGFNMQQSGQLFGVFKRLHSSAEFEGFGVGLANVRRIMQRHGGRVWFDAEADKGATFFVAFPAGDQHKLPSQSEEASQL